MMGKINWKIPEATIIGAGIAGLLIAYRLKQLGFSVKVLESSNRIGGLIQTTQNSFGLFEHAAHSLVMGPVQEKFFDELKVSLTQVDPKSKARYILRNSKLRRMPLNIFEFIGFIFKIFKKHTAADNKLNLKEWGNKFIGDKATKYLLTPFISGIFACKPNELDSSFSFPDLPQDGSLYQWLRKPRTRTKMMTPSQGMESVVLALSEKLKDEIQLNINISSLPSVPNLILCIPTDECAKLIQPHDPESASKLKKTKYSPLISVSMFIHKSIFRKIPNGVGVLAPPQQGIKILGILFNSSSFPERSQKDLVSLTCMLGGTGNPSMLQLSDTEILSLCIKDIDTLFGLKSNSIEYSSIHRYSHAIPIYGPDLISALESLKSEFCNSPGKLIFSNWTGDVSIRKMIDCVNNLVPEERESHFGKTI